MHRKIVKALKCRINYKPLRSGQYLEFKLNDLERVKGTAYFSGVILNFQLII
jgi:hypothetical protein